MKLIRTATGIALVMKKSEWEKMGNDKRWIGTQAEKKEKSPKEHGFIDQCIEKNKGKVDDPGAYCASIVDKTKGTTKWRSEK
jgi:hypothetical protein